MPQARDRQILRFGVFEANLSARELRKHGTRVRLRGQPFCILSMLLEKPGEVITREEMQQKLWPADTFVDFEHSLNSAIKKLRAALGDSPENSRYIETIPRVGYRFIAPVREVQPATLPVAEAPANLSASSAPVVPPAPIAPNGRPKSGGLVVAGSVLLAVLAVTTLLWWRFHSRLAAGAGEKVSLAVLPFVNLTGDPGQEYFSDGLTEEIIAQLGRVNPDQLSVIARTSVMHYKSSSEPLPQIGSELGVQYVLEGSVRKDSGRVRITAQLVRVRGQTPVWSREYDRDLAGLLTLQLEVAQEVAVELQVALGGAPKPVTVAGKSSVSPGSYEVYDLYLQGRYFWNKRTKDGFLQAADYFQQATVRDPSYARAYAGLADTYGLISTWHMGPQDEFMGKARAAALKALQLDDTLAEAHTSLALVAENYDYDWQTAEKEFKRAIQLDPNYATAHQWYAECLSWLGRFDEAVAESERARQLDPLSIIIAADHATILYYARQYDRAIAQSLAVLNMDPNAPRAASVLVGSYVLERRFADAQAYIDDREPTRDNAWLAVHKTLVYGYWGRAAQARGELTKAERFAWNPQERVPALLAAYAATGQRDLVISLLQKAAAEHSSAVTSMKVEPFYDPLRGDPRFQDLLRRVGLADNLTEPHTRGR